MIMTTTMTPATNTLNKPNITNRCSTTGASVKKPTTMTTSKLLTIAVFIFVGFFATCLCFVLAFQPDKNKNTEQAETAHINTHYELPKLIPVAWYVGK